MGALGHLEKVMELCVKLITHDPNYNDDDHNSSFNPVSEESMDTTTGDEDEDLQNDNDVDEEEDEYSDDDDMSWKVSFIYPGNNFDLSNLFITIPRVLQC